MKKTILFLVLIYSVFTEAQTPQNPIFGSVKVKERISFIRQFDGNPAASIGYEDTGFNFSVSAGGGASFLTFRQQAAEVARFGVATGALMIGQTTGETVGYKLLVNGKGAVSGNLYSPNFTDLSAKRWYIFGDSFSNGLDGSDYVSNVVSNLELVATTYAVPGNTSSEQLTVLKNQLTANPTWLTDIDIISIHIGVNDQYSSAVALGNINSPIGDGSISSNIKEFIQLALARNPKIRLFVITPPEANGGTSGRTYKSPNALGWNLENLSTTLSAISKYYSVQCVDLYSLAQFNLQTIPTMTSDGLHPSNPQGLKQLGDIVSRAFTSNHSAGVSTITDNLGTGYMPFKSGNNSFSNSSFYYNGSSTGLGTITPLAGTVLDVVGIVNSSLRYTLQGGVKANQLFGAGNVFNLSDPNNIGIRNDAGRIVFAAGSAAEDVIIETNGNVSGTGKFTAGAAATAANDLMRKGEVDSGFLSTSNNQSFSGQKSANNGTGKQVIILDTNVSTNSALTVSNTTASQNSLYVINGTTGTGILVSAPAGVTSTKYVSYENNGSEVYKVDQLGNNTANSYIKSGGTSSQALMADGSVSIILSGSATLNFPSTAMGTSSELTITVTGAADGDVVSLGIPNVSALANSSYSARVSAANTVTVKFNNYSVLSHDPASGTFKVKVFK